jgi:hypothetical protein
LLTAEANVGNGFWYVDLAEQISVRSVAAHAVLVRIAPTNGAPDAAVAVATHAVDDARLGHFREDLAVQSIRTVESIRM